MQWLWRLLGTPNWAVEIIESQESIMSQNDALLAEVNDLKAAVAVINDGTDTMQANLDAAKARIAELEAAGVAPETVAALTDAVDGVQAIADRFSAAADPEVPTPTDPTPAPVEDVEPEA